MKNYYHILGVRESASPDEIKRAYRRLAFQYHPDTNTDVALAERIKEINEAKHVLLNDVNKSRYDMLLEEEHKSNGFFTKRREAKPKPEPTVVSAAVVQKRKRRVAFSVGGSVVLVLLFLFIINIEPKVTQYFSKSMASAAPATIPDNVASGQNTASSSANAAPANSPENTGTVSGYTATSAEVTQPSTGPSPNVNNTTSSGYSSSTTAKEAVIPSPLPKATPASKTAEPKKPNAVASTPPLTTPKLRVTKQEALKPAIKEKVLSEQEMLAIVSDIKAASARVNKTGKCVKLLKSAAGNVSNAFDLAAKLSASGFTISGREVVNSSYRGVAVDVSGDCVKVLIGTM